MDVDVVWSPNAERDLDEIAAYISNDSRNYAASFVTRVLRVCKQLRLFPQSGRTVPEFNDSALRERVIMQYRLIYRFRGNDVLILALLHGRRLLPESFDT